MAGHLTAARLFAQQAAPTTPGLAPAEGDIRDVKGLWVPDYSKIIYAALILAAILALLALGIWLYKKWRNSRKQVKSLSELTLEQLEEAKRLIRDGNAHEFLGTVSDVVRRYLELRFNLPVTQQTTEEFLRTPALVSEAMLESHSELLKAFLQYCDLVKFARSEFNVEQMNLMLYSAVQFVEATAQPTTGQKDKDPAQPAIEPVPQGEAS